MKPLALRLLIALLSLPLFGLHSALKRQPHPQEVAQLSGGFTRPGEWRAKIAPDFELVLLDGTHFKLSDRVGKEVRSSGV